MRVLVIEDSTPLRKTLVRALSSAGYDVTDAPDGSVGIRLFHEQDVDLIITDIFMPKKEGLETIIELRRQHPKVRILAISGGDRFGEKTAYLDLARHLGANVTLEKPFNRQELLAAVEAALQS